MQRTLQILLAVHLLTSSAVAQQETVSFVEQADQVVIQVSGKPIATYVFRDDDILRPFFANVQAPEGIQVTRNHPPQPGDRDDHAAMHPGIWLAFGDLGGADFWRNRGRVKHMSFRQRPASERNVGSFVENKRYERADGSVVCDEEFRFAIQVQEQAYLLVFESIFTSTTPFYFGDQEEMGLGIRVATPISELAGGKLEDSKGRESAAKIWSHSANWCNYAGRDVGIAIFCHPSNFGPSWFHARNYGLLAANPFGRAAMKKGPPSKVIVDANDKLRLRYAVWIHASTDSQAIEQAYQAYAKLGGD